MPCSLQSIPSIPPIHHPLKQHKSVLIDPSIHPSPNTTQNKPHTGPTWVAGDNVERPSGGNSFDSITCSCVVPVQPAAATEPENQMVYENPKILGHPLDFCLYKGKKDSCGKPAADAFCESFGSRESVRFEALNAALVVGETWMIGDHKTNNATDRQSFKSITCV